MIAESFGSRLRRFRLETKNPETGKPFSQEGMSVMLNLGRRAFHRYENNIRTPHQLIRRELERIWPSLFNPDG